MGGQGTRPGCQSSQQEQDVAQQPDPGPMLSATKLHSSEHEPEPQGLPCEHWEHVLAEVECAGK